MKHRRLDHAWQVGLLAGEKATYGYRVSKFGNKTPRVFKPNVQRVAFFSDILDRSILFRVSPSAILHIDSAGGIDNYLLKTPPAFLQSMVALRWRRFLEQVKGLGGAEDT